MMGASGASRRKLFLRYARSLRRIHASRFGEHSFLPTLNPIEPPWYGPVCPVVWEGWHREVSPYPDLCPTADLRSAVLLVHKAGRRRGARKSTSIGNKERITESVLAHAQTDPPVTCSCRESPFSCA